MWIILLGSIVTYIMVGEISNVEPQKQGTVYFDNGSQFNSATHNEKAFVKPLSSQRYRNVINQAYDFSCGSAALTTLLDFHFGYRFSERQVMEGLLKFGESSRIATRRAFSLLDMKRLVTAIGHKSGGFHAQKEDLINLEYPAIAPIQYAGFKHFVVIKTVFNNHVYVADPALGNISFTVSRFMELWDKNVLFIVFPDGRKTTNGLELVESDMRIVADETITLVAQKTFPQWLFPQDSHLDNLTAKLQDNAYKDTEGNILTNNGFYINTDGNKVIYGSYGSDERMHFDPSKVNLVYAPDIKPGVADTVNKTLHWGRK